MTQIKGIDSHSFWRSGFVVQIHEDQFFLAEGPFEIVSLHKSEYTEYIAVNDLLIKPDYWNFLETNSQLINGLKPKSSHWLSRKEFHDLVFDRSEKTTQAPLVLKQLKWENQWISQSADDNNISESN